MFEVVNFKLRLNTDETNENLIGWCECVLKSDNHEIYINNVKVRKKKLDDGKWTAVFEYPHKVITKSGIESKKYYMKPINKDTYELLQRAFSSELIKALKAARNE